MIRRPPDAPAASHGLPSSIRISGDILVSGRLPGAMEFACPGRGSNQIMPLFISTPVPGNTTRLPMEDINVVVIATIVPSVSHTVRCVVQVSAAIESASPRPDRRST